MSGIRFQQVDVFTSVPFKGNPVAVILDGNNISTVQMQAIANWTNLSETTFVVAPADPAADYRLRIFSPRTELPFAGHPTIGSAHALLRAGYIPKRDGVLIQECGKGLVDLRIDGDRLFLRLPEPVFTEPAPRQIKEAAAALGIPVSTIERAEIVDVGPIWFTLQLRDDHEVTNLNPDMAAIRALSSSLVSGLNIFNLSTDRGPADVEVRSFAPADGVDEDPVCGSGNGCVAAVIRRHKLLARTSYVASQGRCRQRDGRIEVRFDEGGSIWLGGKAITCIEGVLSQG